MDGYGKRPLWQWIVIYLVVGGIIYAGIYYFFLAKKDGYSTPSQAPVQQSQNSQNTVTLTADGFSPASLTIKAGDKVMWVNKSGEAATVDSNPHPIHTAYSALNLGNFPDGGVLSLTFDRAGTYGYHNHLNSSKQGTIVVE